MSKILSTTLSVIAVAVAIPVHATTWQQRNPIIHELGNRADEDWSYVDQLQESEKSFTEKLKRISFSENGDWKASFNMSAKVEFQNQWNSGFDSDSRVHNEVVGQTCYIA